MIIKLGFYSAKRVDFQATFELCIASVDNDDDDIFISVHMIDQMVLLANKVCIDAFSLYTP